MAAGLQFTLSNPMPGMEDEFNRWYGGEHAEHGLKVPGILGGQRFRRIPNGPWPAGKHDYMMIWEMDDPKFALEQLAAAREGDKMPISPSIDMTTVQPPTMWLRAGVRNRARVVTDTSSRKTVVLALVNAVKDQAPAFEKAIMNGTLAGIADLPGVIAAEFFTLADEQIRGSARKFAYGLLIELADEKTAIEALAGPLSDLPHRDRENWMAPVFRPLGDRMIATPGVRTTRK
jgi:hypothetical protein